MVRLVAAMILAAACLPMVGCGIPGWWLGAQQGALFAGMDSVTPLGEPTELQASLLGGSFLSGQSDYTVFFRYDGQAIGATKTNAVGAAHTEYTFDRPGQHTVTTSLDPAELGTRRAPTSTLLATVLPRDTPLILIDIDKTVIASDFDQVLLSDPDPYPNSQRVLRELEEGPYEIVLITGRLQHFMRRTRQWLEENDYPVLPLLLKNQEQLMLSPAEFKRVRIAQLKHDFPNLQWMIDDRVADALEAAKLGLRIILFVTPDDMTAGALTQFIEEIRQLPPDSQVVFDWQQIQQVVDEKADYSRMKREPELAALAQKKAIQQRENYGPASVPAGGSP